MAALDDDIDAQDYFCEKLMNLIVLTLQYAPWLATGSFTQMYPKTYAPYDGIFVREQVKALKQVVDGTITVIVPVPWSPRLLWFMKSWSDYGRAERYNLRHPEAGACPSQALQDQTRGNRGDH